MRHLLKVLHGGKGEPHFFASEDRALPVGPAALFKSRFSKNLFKSTHPGGFFDKKSHRLAQPYFGLTRGLSTTGDVQLGCVGDVAGLFFPDLNRQGDVFVPLSRGNGCGGHIGDAKPLASVGQSSNIERQTPVAIHDRH